MIKSLKIAGRQIKQIQKVKSCAQSNNKQVSQVNQLLLNSERQKISTSFNQQLKFNFSTEKKNDNNNKSEKFQSLEELEKEDAQDKTPNIDPINEEETLKQEQLLEEEIEYKQPEFPTGIAIAAFLMGAGFMGAVSYFRSSKNKDDEDDGLVVKNKEQEEQYQTTDYNLDSKLLQQLPQLSSLERNQLSLLHRIETLEKQLQELQSSSSEEDKKTSIYQEKQNEMYVKLGACNFYLDKVQEAQNYLTKIVQQGERVPYQFQALQFLGGLEIRKQNYTQAIKYFEMAKGIKSNSSEVLNNIGFAYQQSGDLENAIKYFNQAIRLDSKNLSALYNKGVSQIYQKKFKEGVNSLERVLPLDSQDYLTLTQLALGHFKLQNYDEAVHFGTLAVRCAPSEDVKKSMSGFIENCLNLKIYSQTYKKKRGLF
ncbi:hypothetical protein PPERSA_12569 [Pseudocohnilembus persalinus]|uniref:Uncharacterized protein n=1 Tax=Pseudocohnilembus persalinus TaxID=266149 RepID=A0A0V0QCE4_PSEPJ|nr:hypothetical protein PPERSA_12569 [Pseudocohnilembus persalinus]|eukprot:KRW99893.1 hypothetical protein PPERSA_12569 [Pseudocohnilembus persalinus]